MTYVANKGILYIYAIYIDFFDEHLDKNYLSFFLFLFHFLSYFF